MAMVRGASFRVKAVRVLVADPTDGGSERITKLLSENPRIEVVASARTGAEAIRKTALTLPHVVTMDIQFVDMNAAQIISVMSAMAHRPSVYLIGPHVTPENPLLKQALDAGAYEFIRCSRSAEDLEKYSRQIINTIFVAGLSSSKQIPAKEGNRRAEGLDGLLLGKRVIVVFWAADRMTELPGFLTGARIGPSADVMVVADQPPDQLSKLLRDLGEVAGGRTVQGMDRGCELTGGRIWVTARRKHDVAIGAGPMGRETIQFKDRIPPSESGPNLDALMKSAAGRYGDKAVAIMVGGDGTEGVYGLKAVQDAGGVTIVEELSVEFLGSLRKWLPNAKIPRVVASLENLRVLMRELK
jgi:two-component system chemotaxis response regulator CheB